MSHLPQPVIIQRDREIFSEDIDHICIILERFPSLSRKEVVHTLCETLEWLTPAGLPKVDACFKLLHRLEAAGIVRLFPWVKVPNLASHILGQLTRRVGDDW